MKKKHYVLLICLLLILTLAVLYLCRNPSTHGDGIREIVAEASPPPRTANKKVAQTFLKVAQVF